MGQIHVFLPSTLVTSKDFQGSLIDLQMVWKGSFCSRLLDFLSPNGWSGLLHPLSHSLYPKNIKPLQNSMYNKTELQII